MCALGPSFDLHARSAPCQSAEIPKHSSQRVYMRVVMHPPLSSNADSRRHTSVASLRLSSAARSSAEGSIAAAADPVVAAGLGMEDAELETDATTERVSTTEDGGLLTGCATME